MGYFRGLKSGKFWDMQRDAKENRAIDTTASDTFAQLIRDQWDDYKTRFAPWEDKLVSMAMGKEDNLLSEQRAANAVDGAFNNAAGTLGRNRQRLGLTLTAEEQANENRLTAGLQAATKNSTVMKARLHAQDRDNSLLAGGAGPNINTALEKPQ